MLYSSISFVLYILQKTLNKKYYCFPFVFPLLVFRVTWETRLTFLITENAMGANKSDSQIRRSGNFHDTKTIINEKLWGFWDKKQAFNHRSAALPKTSFPVFPCEFWEIFQNSCCAVIPEILCYIIARFVFSLLATSKLQLYPKTWFKFDVTCCNVKKNKVDINRTLFFSEKKLKKN